MTDKTQSSYMHYLLLLSVWSDLKKVLHYWANRQPSGLGLQTWTETNTLLL